MTVVVVVVVVRYALRECENLNPSDSWLRQQQQCNVTGTANPANPVDQSHSGSRGGLVDNFGIAFTPSPLPGRKNSD